MAKTVVVVGGGITGAFAAYFLTELGARVFLVDPGDQPYRSSANNPGGLNPLHGPGIPGEMSAFAMRCYRMHLSEWPAIADVSRTGFSGRVVTRVLVAFTDDEAHHLTQMMQLYEDKSGFSAEWLERDALLGLDRRISGNVVGGLLTYGNASVDAVDYNNAVIKAACVRGAVEKQGRVCAVEASDGRIRRVFVGSESLPCDQVVFATGPWLESISSISGVTIPVRPVRGQLLLAEAISPAPEHDITWKHYGIYHQRGKSFWLGGTFEETEYDGSTTFSGRQAIMKGLSTVVPSIVHSKIRRHMAGLRPMTPDGLPILDRIPGYENAWLALGGGSKGMLLSSGLGQAAAEMAVGTDGEAAPALFSLARFGLPQTHRQST